MALGDVIRTIPAPGTAGGIQGLDFDGKYLWACNFLSPVANRIIQLDLLGNIIRTFTNPGTTRPFGIYVNNGTIIHGDYTTDVIYFLDFFGNVKYSWAAPNLLPTGLVMDSPGWPRSGKTLYIADATTNLVYQTDLFGNVIRSFPAPGSTGGVTGLTFDGKNLYLAQFIDNIVYIMSVGGAVLTSFATPGTSSRGIAFDGKYLWLADLGTNLIYQISRN